MNHPCFKCGRVHTCVIDGTDVLYNGTNIATCARGHKHYFYPDHSLGGYMTGSGGNQIPYFVHAHPCMVQILGNVLAEHEEKERRLKPWRLHNF